LYAVSAADVLATIFWLAGFLALAVATQGIQLFFTIEYQTAVASIVLGALLWYDPAFPDYVSES